MGGNGSNELTCKLKEYYITVFHVFSHAKGIFLNVIWWPIVHTHIIIIVCDKRGDTCVEVTCWCPES